MGEKRANNVLFLIFFLALIFLVVSLISSFQITTFDNSLASENLTFTGNQNITRNLTINRYANVTSGFMNLSGFNSSNSFCYQETANVSTSCGGLNTGIYNFTGNWYSTAWRMIDGEWTSSSSYSQTSGSDAHLYINYTKPIGIMNGSIWQIAPGTAFAPTLINLSLPNNCWTQNPIRLKISFVYFISQFEADCYNGTDWEILLYNYGTYNYFYEEAIFWNISSSPTNVSLTINNTPIWNFTASTSTPDSIWITGLLNYYNFDEGTGAIANSEINITNPITLNSSLWGTGIIGNAGNFSELRQYGNISYNSADWNWGNYSISLWIKGSAQTTENPQVFARNPTSVNYLDLIGDNSTHLRWGSSNTSHTLALYTNKNVWNNSWHNLVITRNNVTANVSLWVDGVLSASSTSGPNAMITGISSGVNIALGYAGTPQGGGRFINGSIDEMAIWNITLNSSQIDYLWNNSNGTTFSSQTITGEFTQQNNKTSDFSSALNTVLNSGSCDCIGCFLNSINNSCTIPFLFHSDTAGILQYSAIDININPLSVYGLTQLHSNNTQRIFGFFIANLDSSAISNVTWKVNTGLANVSSQYNSSLQPGKSKYVVFEYNYTSSGNYTVIATATSGSITDSESIEVNI